MPILTPPDRPFSYARPEDPRMKRGVIRTLERLTGSRHLQKIYEAVYAEGHDAFSVWEAAISKLNITMDYDEDQLAKVPKSGPVIFVANHPFGVVDGAFFLHLVTRVRQDYFILINEVLSHEPIVAGHLLPVDFRSTEAAKETNLETRRLTRERLLKGEALAIFPSGGVATARPPWGIAEEFPWRTYICGLIHETQCTVIPIYFYGQNSRLFHTVSQVSMNLRLGLLLHEIRNKRNSTIAATIGEPIPYSEMAELTDRKVLIKYLQEKTLSLVIRRK